MRWLLRCLLRWLFLDGLCVNEPPDTSPLGPLLTGTLLYTPSHIALSFPFLPIPENSFNCFFSLLIPTCFPPVDPPRFPHIPRMFWIVNVCFTVTVLNCLNSIFTQNTQFPTTSTFHCFEPGDQETEASSEKKKKLLLKNIIILLKHKYYGKYTQA